MFIFNCYGPNLPNALTADYGIRNFISGSLEKVLAPVLRHLYPIRTVILFCIIYLPSAYRTSSFFSGLCSIAQQPLVGQSLLIIDASRSHSESILSVGLLWTSDHPVTEIST